MNKTRITVYALCFSAAGFVGYLEREGYAPVAAPPVVGDVPTYGFGSTKNTAGQPLRSGEKITPMKAVQLAARDVAVHDGRLKKCLDGVIITQNEYDALLSLELNTGGVCGSSIPGKLRAGQYAAACQTILDFDGFCTKPKVKVGGKLTCPAGARKRLPGLTARRRTEYAQCMGQPSP